MFNNNKDVCAVILAGGKSSRMGGGIKTLKTFNNKLIFDRIFENLICQTKNILININNYDNHFRKYNVQIIKDSLDGFLGPLAGIHASLKWLTTNKKKINWLVSVPGDTPFIPTDLINKLLNSAINGNYKIVISKSNGKTHPIIGIWHSSLLESLETDLISGTRKILEWADKHSLGYVEFDNAKYDVFFNINFEKDLLYAEKIENNYISSNR